MFPHSLPNESRVLGCVMHCSCVLKGHIPLGSLCSFSTKLSSAASLVKMWSRLLIRNKISFIKAVYSSFPCTVSTAGMPAIVTMTCSLSMSSKFQTHHLFFDFSKVFFFIFLTARISNCHDLWKVSKSLL